MMKKWNWEAFSSFERTSIIEEVKSTISSNSGAIMNFNMFSDLALNLSIEIEEKDIPKLHSALTKVLSVSNLDNGKLNKMSNKENFIFLNISFASGEGKLKNVIPEVPG